MSSAANSSQADDLSSREPPSNEVLEFYRRKVAILAADSEYFQKQLDEISNIIDHQHYLRLQLQEKEDVIMDLKNQISKLETDLHAERDHVLRLYAENDRLKLREIDYRKSIERLRRLVDMSFSAHSSIHTTEDWRSLGSGYRRDPLKDYDDENKTKLKSERLEQDLDSVQKSLFVLRKQFAEQTTALEERIRSLLIDRERRIQDEGQRAEMYRIREAELLDQLKRSQLMLQEMASEYLHLRLKHRLSEKTWIAEKEELIGCIKLGILRAKIDSLRKIPNTSQSKPDPLPSLFKSELLGQLKYDKLDSSRKREWELRQNIEELETRFDRQQKLANRYRDQIIQIEEANLQIREECSQSNNIYTNKIQQLKERNQLYAKRYEDLERRRKHEIEGYQTDITLLKKKLADAEVKLRQVVQATETESETQIEDRSTWKTVKLSAATPSSKLLAEELWKLKDLMHALN